MKQLLLVPLVTICMLQVNNPLINVEKNTVLNSYSPGTTDGPVLNLLQQPGNEKMLAVVFRSQQFCRAELKDFEFDAHFSIVSATLYFSGTNFKNVEKGTITSSSFKPVSSLMARCAPGSMVIFDNVKVVGPDSLVRTVPGPSYVLY